MLNFRAIWFTYIAVGRRISRSATSAAIIAKALSQPNSRSDGRSENTITASPQDSTTEVRISAGPTRMVACSTPMLGSSPGLLSSRRRLRKWIVALSPSPNETVSATTLANCRPSPIAQSTVPATTTGKMPGRMLTSITANERKARPMKAATKTISIVSARLSLPIMSALLRAAIAESPVTEIS